MTEHQPAEYTEMAAERAGGLRLMRRMLVVLSVAVALNAAFTAWQFFRLGDESGERRSQICVGAERDDRDEIARLNRTYEYLLSLSPRQRRSPLNQLVIRTLPETEANARTVTAPEFCTEPGVGLPGPAPRVPDRPAGLPVK
jgi:hypothetical protein